MAGAPNENRHFELTSVSHKSNIAADPARSCDYNLQNVDFRVIITLKQAASPKSI
jgi:hypothetical protein